LPRSELRRALVAKLFEGSQELLLARDPDDVKAELADLLEVIRSISIATGVDWNEVEVAATDKRGKRGGFESGAVLILAAWPAPGRPTQRTPLLITLRKLARVTADEHQTTVSFNALVAAGEEGADITFGGQEMRVHLTRDGLHIRKPVAGAASAQLDLPLTMPDKSGVAS
jgi:predicted house-cleaning noncanonical NTP pyrophosphatase (MazG superfamily)